MCGIVGVTNYKKAAPFLLSGLKALEYRGYDSAGIFVKNGGLVKTLGRVEGLDEKVVELRGTDGIGHTRWATHGGVSLSNAHPHQSYDQKVTLVHNGVIKNYQSIKKELLDYGCLFQSETDTEVLANYIAYLYQRESNIDLILKNVLKKFKGEMAVALIFSDRDGLYYIKRGSPLILAKQGESYFIASDLSAISGETDQVFFPKDGEFGHLAKDVQYRYFRGHRYQLKFSNYQAAISEADKKDHQHFMKKEIDEEVEVVRRLESRYCPGGKLSIDPKIKSVLSSAKRIVMLGCGTSFYATDYNANYFRNNLPIIAEVASEFTEAEDDACYILVSQSGETYDLLRAVKLIRRKDRTAIIALTNVSYSSLARLADYHLDLCAGPEIAVASTKSYISSMIILNLLFHGTLGHEFDGFFPKLKSAIKSAFRSTDRINSISDSIKNISSCYFIGHKCDFSLAREGALKLKEVSYIHSESVLSGELKHGPIATLSPEFPVIAVASSRHLLAEIETNLKESKARLAPVFVFTTAPVLDESNSVRIKKGPTGLEGVGIAVALQLLCYFTSLRRGVDIDKPRNLAKSVTVR